MKTLEKLKLNFFRWALFHMKTRFSLRYFVSYCSSVLILSSSRSLFGDLNSAGAPLSFPVFILRCTVFNCKLYLVLKLFHSLVCILPRTHWIFAAFISCLLDLSNLFNCCLKYIFLSSNLSRIPCSPKFHDQIPWLQFFVCLSISQNGYIDRYFFNSLPLKFPKTIQLIASSVVFFLHL